MRAFNNDTRRSLTRQALFLLAWTIPIVVLADKPASRQIIIVQDSSPQKAQIARPRIRAVHVDAYIANWDADVETDGLVVRVHPLDSTGNLVAVRGTLRVQMIVARPRNIYAGPRSQRHYFDRVGQWTLRVQPRDFGRSGARYKLPFQAVNPERVTVPANQQPKRFEPQFGLVHAQLVVPGAGVFEDSRDAVNLRPFSPVRDALQRSQSRRFFSIERTARGRR